MNLFETLLHPDREEDEERAKISHAANLLQVGEFQLLQLAYVECFGREMDAQTIESMFGEFMVAGRTPHWVSRYAQSIIDLEASGRLDDRTSSYHRFDSDYYSPVPLGKLRFALAVTMIIGCVGGGIMVGQMANTNPTSVLPPYFDRNELPSAD
ncbi:MAG: hypothetical protein QF797_15995 [Alphaproteobacteria bacterium]|jgi:hypothetical protein|nr:hypothetical protein [Rhodospirillaceae bacterium]MDP6406698.1 hypothetical protein [Alphaproteobacteria bacterium]MDP6622843.1 hypothetical protein [Alphaproteobacteria bacterium]